MLPKTTYEQRAFLYEDVESLLDPGFLSTSVSVCGQRMHIRSLSPGDLYMLRARAQGSVSLEWRTWVVATSVWMINGRCVLGLDDAVPEIAEFLREIPSPAVESVFNRVLSLFDRVRKAEEIVRVYVYEEVSRYRWASFAGGGKVFRSGVPRSDSLGTNNVSQLWQAFNLYEDERNKEMFEWNVAKMIASTQHPEGIKKLDEQDRSQNESERSRRQKARDLLYYQSKGFVDDRGVVFGGDASFDRVGGIKSVDDLEDEMRRWVSNELDEHDEVVEAYKQGIRRKKEESEKRKEAYRRLLADRRLAMEQSIEERDIVSGPVVLTPEQLSRLLEERGDGEGYAVTRVYDEPNTESRVYEKYVNTAPDKGELKVSGGKVLDPYFKDEVVDQFKSLVKGPSEEGSNVD